MTGADFTGADFTGVDIDLLADYVGGALDGTPDQARVAALIVAEPAWQSAHTLLSSGMADVSAALHQWGSEPEPMPANVFSQLESAFAAASEIPALTEALRESTTDSFNDELGEADPTGRPLKSATDSPVGEPGNAGLSGRPLKSATDSPVGEPGKAAISEQPLKPITSSPVGEPGKAGPSRLPLKSTTDSPVGEGGSAGRRLKAVTDSSGGEVAGGGAASESRREAAFAVPVEEPGGGAAASGPGLVSVRKNGLDRRRRQARWGASLAAAAAAVAIAGVGIAYLGSSSPSSSDSAASEAGGSAAAPGLAALPAGGAITSTDRDYTADSLRGDEVTPLSTGDGIVPKAPPSALGSPTGRGESSSRSMATGEGLSGGLTRLRAPAALQACLSEIGTANGAGAISVQSVDYARFAGSPALVVRFTAANGSWAWVSGPACGLPGVGPATAYSVQVG